MLSWFKNEPTKEGIVALDLGTQSVKATVFTVEDKTNNKGEKIGELAEIQGWGQEELMTWNDSVLVNHLDHVIEASKRAINAAARKAKFFPKKIILGIGGQYIKGLTSVLKYEREEPELKINLSELRNIIQKLEWSAFDQVRRQVSHETGFAEIDIKLIDAEIGKISIDGYKAKNPLGFEGKTVEISFFNAFVPITYYSALQEIIKKLELECLQIVSIPYAFSQINPTGEKDPSAIFIDVGATSTQIGVTEKGGVGGVKSFSLAGHTFTKRLAMELNINLKEAEILKKAYASDEMEQKSKKIIAESLQDDLQLWLEALTLTLSELKLNVLPSNIFLSGGGVLLPEIKMTLNQDKWYKKLPFTHQPQAQFLNPRELGFISDKKKIFQGQQNITSLALLKVALNQPTEENIVQKTFKKVVGIMQV